MVLEEILVNGVTEIIKKLLPVITQQITLAWGVKDDLRKLGTTLESIQALISDAETKQVDDATVRLWLSRLKDVVYDADDLMDEFSYETMRRHQLKHKVQDFVTSSNPLVFRFKMAGKISGINQKLDEIYEARVKYVLSSTNNSSHGDQTREQRNRSTSSIGYDSLLLGREGAKLDIVNILTDKLSPASSSLGSSSQQVKLSVVSIVGMGGLGKTSLAQLVFNDESVGRYFDLKLWVCISNDFDVRKILKNILESITQAACDDFSNFDVLAKKVKDRLSGQKYLLVLDDLWNEHTGDWENLKNFLVCGALGSKILVTTRNRKVAHVVGGTIHDLQKLSDDFCWSIIEEKILSRGVVTLELTSIGREIAKKCEGLPLAAMSLGGLMSSRIDESYWLTIVNDNRLWDAPETERVVSILKLSFDSLPSHLKQCFSYCCIFPKDWEINRETLIRLWIAEGLILPPRNGEDNVSVEEVGNHYFEHLLWCSFFQNISRDELGVIRTCKMHDFVHDLAMSVVEPYEFAIAKAYGKRDFSQVRSLQMVCDEESWTALQDVLLDAGKLRTVVALMTRNCPHIRNFVHNKRLRVLCALGDGHYSDLSSSSFPRLKHLRYLYLSNCKIDANHLSLCHSYSLQTLALRRCNNVSIIIGKIGSLKHLRHIDISYSDIKVLPDSIASLTDLQTLELDHCRQFESLPEEIGLLRHLRYLCVSFTPITKLPDSIVSISGMERLRFFGCVRLDALPRDLGKLRHLRCLDLSGTSIWELPESCTSKLTNLEIVHLGDKCVLPKHIGDWRKLRILTHSRERDEMPRGIENLTCLETLDSYLVRKEDSGIEELASLKSLVVLVIRNLENVRGKEDAAKAKLEENQSLRDVSLVWGSSDVGEGNIGLRNDAGVLEGLQPHPGLKKLAISGFSGLQLPEWMGSSSNCALLNLVELRLEDFDSCEKLPSLGLLPCLTDLDIFKMHSVRCLGEDFYHEHNESTAAAASVVFPCLVRLVIRDMESLEEWMAPPPPSPSFTSLEFLVIKNCKRLTSVPFASLSSLKKLNLGGTDDRMVSSILAASREGCLSCLTAIDIHDSPQLTYFPLGLLRDTTPRLHSLRMYRCDNLQAFRDDDPNNNSSSSNSLSSLCLLYCPALTSLPELRLWTSLRELYIENCDKLEESITYDLRKSLYFLETLQVDYIQRNEQLEDPDFPWGLINLMEKKQICLVQFSHQVYLWHKGELLKSLHVHPGAATVTSWHLQGISFGTKKKKSWQGRDRDLNEYGSKQQFGYNLNSVSAPGTVGAGFPGPSLPATLCTLAIGSPAGIRYKQICRV